MPKARKAEPESDNSPRYREYNMDLVMVVWIVATIYLVGVFFPS